MWDQECIHAHKFKRITCNIARFSCEDYPLSLLVELQVMSTINDRIRVARERKGLNQSELATALSVTPQTVQQWEAGKTSPRNKKIDALAKTLEVTSDWLLTGREVLQPSNDNDEELSRQERLMLELFRDLTDDQRAEALRSLETQKQQNDKIWDQLSKIKARKAS